MAKRKLRTVANWHGTFRQEEVKKKIVNQGLRLCAYTSLDKVQADNAGIYEKIKPCLL
jgi:hypothetical protein